MPVLDSIALGGGLAAWAEYDVDSLAPIRLAARRIGAGGRPTGLPRTFATTSAASDERGLDDPLTPDIALADRGDGAVLAGWMSARTRRDADRAGTVRLLDRLGAPVGPARAVTDRGADFFSLAAVPDGFVAVWQRERDVYGSGEVRMRRLDPDGVPRGPALTLGRGDAPVVAGQGFDALVAWARHGRDTVEIVTRRASGGASAAVMTFARPALGVDLALTGDAGRWRLAAAVVPDLDVLATVHALELAPDGATRIGEPRALSPAGSDGFTSMAWLPGPELAWKSEKPQLAELPRVAVAPVG